ncbi:hypothetical protein [Streptomyces sp. NPDC047315]|uniref:hypothetical protein n=1 Tax=Streptomyces sp. NPDC047315 TaxID=3155142 RepID=UPI0033F9C1FA
MWIPATIDGARQVLADGPERLAQFEREQGGSPALELPAFLAAYVLPQQVWGEIEAAIERLRAGDFSGCTSLEDLNDAVAGPEAP